MRWKDTRVERAVIRKNRRCLEQGAGISTGSHRVVEISERKTALESGKACLDGDWRGKSSVTGGNEVWKLSL